MIPARLIRCVPAETTEEVEQFWLTAIDLHPAWDHVTLRDPIDPGQFPLTAAVWPLCGSGAQLAGFVRLEALWHAGGVYVDSDVEVLRPFDELLSHRMFAAYEDAHTIPDAVLGAEAGHPALEACIDLALQRIRSHSPDWRTGDGAWSTGPGVTTTILPCRDDVTLFAPEAFFPYHYTEKHRRHEDFTGNPNTYAVHHWNGSWL
jgi:mannosyltransferase OCH1-like enzyme